MKNYNGFSFVKFLIKERDSTICLLENKKQEKVICNLKKTSFTDEEIKKLFSENAKIEIKQENDKYCKFHIQIDTQIVEINNIFPATESDIKKHSTVNCVFIRETQEIYKNVTLPYIKKQIAPQWILNWVSGHSSEEILYEDEHFVLSPNITWNRNILTELYLLAGTKKAYHSVRDIKDYKLLEDILEKTLETIESKFNLNKNRIVSYVHYYPSFWYFHIHFAYVNSLNAITENTRSVGKAILLNDIIDNIKLDPDYYEKASLTGQLIEGTPLYEEMLKNNKL